MYAFPFKKNGTCCLRCCSKKSVGYKGTHLYYSKKDNHPWTGGISMLYGTKTTHHANVNYACRDFHKNQQVSGASIRKKRGHLPRTCGQRCAKKKKGLGGVFFFFAMLRARARAKTVRRVVPAAPAPPAPHARARSRTRTLAHTHAHPPPRPRMRRPHARARARACACACCMRPHAHD
jgi:hypothetical protein